MNRIDTKFAQLKENNKKALVTFLTLGDDMEDTSEKIILEAEKLGADVIELGIPFSDPSTDTPAVQDAYNRAMINTVDIFKIFGFIKDVRKKLSIPLVFRLYFNVILQYGTEQFFAKCSETGVDAVIIPDLPFEESDEVAEYAQKYEVYQIQLISTTSPERIKAISENAKGFLYCLPASAEKLDELLTQIKQYTSVPVCVDTTLPTTDNYEGFITDDSIISSILAGNSDEEKLMNMAEAIKKFK